MDFSKLYDGAIQWNIIFAVCMFYDILTDKSAYGGQFSGNSILVILEMQTMQME